MYDPDKECEKLVQQIKKLCKLRDISYYSLAKKAGISTSTIHSLMNGKTTPQIYTLLKICNVLGVSIESLFNDSISEENFIEKVSIDLMSEEKEILFYYRCLSEEKKKWFKVWLDMIQQYKVKEI